MTYVNEKGQEVVYNPSPVQFGGVEISGSNKFPTPKVRFANVDGGMSDLSRDFDDLIGFRLIRIRTYGKFLLKLGDTIRALEPTKMLTSLLILGISIARSKNQN